VIECTVGVIHTPGGILFFKNRDLSGKYLADRTTLWRSTPEIYALQGVNLETGEPEGVSFGVNKHRVCVANTHIKSTPDVTYDVLCERLLLEVQNQGDVPGIVEGFMSNHRVQGGRILVSSPAWSFLIEVMGDQFEMRETEGNLVITNHFSLLPHQPQRSAVREQSSSSRLAVALEMLKTIANARQLKAMLRSHLPQRGELSICNHREDGGGTESSHIVQIQGEYVAWSHLVGFPCESDYQTVQLFQE
jgi:hypothetical protein